MLLPGALIGPWRLLEYVGEGAYGIVYRCIRDTEPHSGQYALKWARSFKDERFEREAELLSRIHHANVPGLHDRGLCQGTHHPYLVMDWADGKPLYDWAKARGLTQREACQLLAQVARALEATHLHGVHRDVKGDNVLVSPEGHVKLVDFGMGWYEGARPLTDTAIPPGTEPYRSPQLLRFRSQFRQSEEAHYRYHPADDVYALGVTAYRLVTGRYPPPGTDPAGEVGDEYSRPERLRAPSEFVTVGPQLEKLILRMLSSERAARGTAGELAEALERIATRLGPAGDLPIQPVPSGTASRPRLLKSALPKFALAAASLSLAVWALSESTDRPSVVSEEAGCLAGLGTAAPAAPKKAAPAQHALAQDTPPEPLPGQTPPDANGRCPHKRQEAFKGVCWTPLKAEREECEAVGGQMFKDRCYVPVMPTKRPSPINPAHTP